jgi:hypothetical protein
MLRVRALSLFKRGFGSERAAEGAQASEEEDEKQARGGSAGGRVACSPPPRSSIPSGPRPSVSLFFVRFFASRKIGEISGPFSSPAHILPLSLSGPNILQS